ncbi:tetratricopeptide repeat protein [Chitinimonas arctica]|uniref:Tetratricopeptide repeat protein n=1 Tax=Chitinimonas arctica TaxID=2594795 RepID=A0A516SFP8_9NEIS|nr:tetratricopeptide repeat protein [Chitinimonas arctica]
MAGYPYRILLVVALAAAMSSAWADELSEAEALLASGQAASAYRMLAPLEFQRAGEARYDYLLGSAALDSGRAAEATLALERILQRDPDHAGARLELGRAYYALGDDSRAKTEFETLLLLDPPAPAKQAIRTHLQAIAQRSQAKSTQLGGYLMAGVGRDNNLNFATDQARIFVPVFNGDLTLTSDSLGKRDNLLLAGAGADLTHAVNERLGLFAGADWQTRRYTHEKAFRYDTLALRFGMAFGTAANQLRLGGRPTICGRAATPIGIPAAQRWNGAISPVPVGNGALGANTAGCATNARIIGSTTATRPCLAPAMCIHSAAHGKVSCSRRCSAGRRMPCRIGRTATRTCWACGFPASSALGRTPRPGPRWGSSRRATNRIISCLPPAATTSNSTSASA